MSEQNLFDGATIIISYTAEEAVHDGVLIHFNPATALECGYRIPVLLTTAAHAEAIAWTGDEGMQSEDARFWDVLWMARGAAKATCANPGQPFEFVVLRIPNDGASETASELRLKIVAEMYNTQTGCLIIALPDDD